MKPAKDCQTMAELRAQIDLLDRELVALLVQRAGYIDRAIELKPGENLPARIEPRVAAVLDNVRATARAAGLDPELATDLWQRLIEWSIAREERVLGPSGPSQQDQQK